MHGVNHVESPMTTAICYLYSCLEYIILKLFIPYSITKCHLRHVSITSSPSRDGDDILHIFITAGLKI